MERKQSLGSLISEFKQKLRLKRSTPNLSKSSRSPTKTCIKSTASFKKQQSVRFSESIPITFSTWHKSDYDRSVKSRHFTMLEIFGIQTELNHYKLTEMSIHPSSKGNIHLY
jgi:flagellar biosynthesis GTPase FlhF